MNVKYGINGDNYGDSKQFNSDDTPLLDKDSAEDMEEWTVAELKPTTSSEANNLYSFRLFLRGTVDGEFAINDISIVYRSKRIK